MDSTNQHSILNLAAALERVGGDNELLEEVAKLFLESAPDLLGHIREAIVNRDAQAVQHAAHTLKGSVGNFGAEATFEAAFLLEKMGRSGDLSGVEEAYATLESEMHRLEPALVSLAGGG